MTHNGREYFRYRSYQMRARKARKDGCKRFYQVIHRRGGKDRSWMAITFEESLERVGNYFHFFPSLNQGKRDIWDNKVLNNYDGHEETVAMLDMFPKEFVVSKNETELQVTLINGSIWQIMGADNDDSIDRARGSNPLGIVFSEYAFMDPKAWKVLTPVLAENGGWAAFITTPKDEGHGYELYQYAKTSPNWFCELLTVDDTRRDAFGENGERVVTEETIEEIRKEGTMTEVDIQREFYCSWKGFTGGTIFGDLITRARDEGRVRDEPYIVNAPVGVCFDIGMTDATAIWFYQIHGNKISFIDYEEDNLKSAHHWAKVMREKQYIYGRMCLPWDARWSAGDYFSTVGFSNIDYAKKLPLQTTIDAVREQFSRFYFDISKCARGIKCLENYKRPWDVDARTFKPTPVHDEYSHGASAMRTGAIAGFGPLLFPNAPSAEIKVETEFDLFNMNKIEAQI